MQRRAVLFVVIALVLPGLAGIGCARNLNETGSVSSTTLRPESLQEAAGLDSRAILPSAGSADGGAAAEPGARAITPEDLPDPGPADFASPTTSTTSTVIDRDELEEQLPDLGAVRACVQLNASYQLLPILALNGADGAVEAQRIAVQLKDLLPPALHGQVDTVVRLVTAAATEGVLEGGAALQSSEYRSASATLSNFFTGGCTGG